MSNQLKYSSELMTNFLPATLMPIQPITEFEALQTSTGNALLFSIGNDNNLWLTQEVPYYVQSNTEVNGWVQTNLSELFIQSNNLESATVKDFSVAQNFTTNTLSITMVVSTSSGDQVCAWLGCPMDDAYWVGLQSNGTTAPVTEIQWILIPFDDVSHQPTQVSVSDIFLSEVESNEICTLSQFIVVDIYQDPGNSQNLWRYCLDTTSIGTETPVWVCQINEELVAPNMNSIGRIGPVTAGQPAPFVDGVYTATQLGSTLQVNFNPALNQIGRITYNSSDLNVDQSSQLNALTTCRNNDQSTDLYFIANDGTNYSLYCNTASDQANYVAPILVQSNPLFIGTTKLFAFEAADTDNDCIIVWGLNSNNSIFYTTCPIGQQGVADAWTTPVTIVSGVDCISPYVNSVSNGNTIFAFGGNELFILTRSPQTTIWNTQTIQIPVPNNSQGTPMKSVPINSYTTTIQLLDENGNPLANSPVMINTVQGSQSNPLPGNRVNFFANYLYTIIDNTPLVFMTDNGGNITLIETVNGISGTQLQVTANGANSLFINPMDNVISGLSAINTSQGLSSAVITNVNGTTTSLVPQSTSSDNLTQAASGFNNLLVSYQSLGSSSFAQNYSFQAQKSDFDLGSSILVDIGDLFNLCKEFFEDIVEVIVSVADGVYNILVTIGDTIYSAVLDAVEKIAGAVDWILSAIKVVVDDIIKYLGFLFNWSDIVRTKDVFANVISLYINYLPAKLLSVQNDIDTGLANFQTDIANWGNINLSGLGSNGGSPLGNGTQPPTCSTSQSILTHHFQNNAQNLTYVGTIATPSNGDPITALITYLQNEASTIEGQLEAWVDALKNISTSSVSDFLTQLVALVAELGVELLTDIVNLLFKCVEAIGELIISVLTCPIYIPVVSDILDYFFNIQSPSMMDVFSYVAAIPATLGYKLVTDKAPFQDDEITTFLTTATDFNTLIQAFNSPNPSAISKDSVGKITSMDDGPIPMDDNLQCILATTFHGAAGVLGIVFAVVDTIDAISPVETTYGTAGTVLALAIVGLQDGSNFLVPRDPVQSETWNIISLSFTGFRGLLKILFFAASKVSEADAQELRGLAATVDAVMAIPALAVTIEHFVELSSEPQDDAWGSAIFDEASNISGYLGRIGYAIALNTEDEEVKAIAAAGFAAARLLYSVYQIEESVLEATQITS